MELYCLILCRLSELCYNQTKRLSTAEFASIAMILTLIISMRNLVVVFVQMFHVIFFSNKTVIRVDCANRIGD